MKKLVSIMLIAMFGLSFKSPAQGDLLITPKRVLFEGNKQLEELSLVNTGEDTTTYSISLLHYNMQEDGSLITVEKPDPGQMFADSYLRIFPRQVTLAPGEPQVIMLQCRRTPDMQAGEYRSHLYFRSEKKYNPLGMGNSLKDTTLLSVQLIPIYGMSIPVIIHSAPVNMNAALVDLNLETREDSSQFLKLTISRTGNVSVYGDLSIKFIPAKGKVFELDARKGIGVYTNINKRNVSIKLNPDQGKRLKNGKLKVQYISNNEDKKTVVYAEGELDIQ
jgi:hypothetical protein